MKQIIADNLKRLRQANRLTQAAVAEGIGVNHKTFQKYEEGRAYPPIPKLKAIAEFYAHTVDDLLTENLEVSWKKVRNQ